MFRGFTISPRAALLTAVSGFALVGLAGCNALGGQNTTTVRQPAPLGPIPSNFGGASTAVFQPNAGVAGAAGVAGFGNAGSNVVSNGGGFSVQPATLSSPGFPDATLDPNGTVGRYQIGPSYNLNGQIVTPRENLGYNETGFGGWYGDGFEGATTANGEKLNSRLRTFAHRTLPFGTIARLTNTANGRSVVARVNDRGPIQTDRLIDVTTRLSEELAFNNAGRARIQVQVLPQETRRVAALTGGAVGTVNGSAPTLGSVGLPSGTSGISVSPLASPTPVGTNAFGTSFAPLTPSLGGGQALASPTPLNAANSGVVSGAGTGGVYIQAGSFSQRANADRLRSLLASVGSTQVDPVTVNAQQYWRVRLGPYGSESEARVALGRVVSLGATDAVIRR